VPADFAPETLGTIVQAEGYLQARLERNLDHDQATVWQMLTVPARLAQWLAPGEIELRHGGAVNLHFADSGTTIDSTVSACEPPRLLEYSWSDVGEPDRPVCWALASAGTGTSLSLTLRIPAEEDIARTCAGWEAHLAMLAAALDGAPIAFPFERFQAAREAYKLLA
jgi:uncharacterized protein YndB with AHSA1/START domain